MQIGVAGPADLLLLKDDLHADFAPRSRGYPFPMTSNLVIELMRQGHRLTVFTTDPCATRAYELLGPSLKVCVIPSRGRARARAHDFFAQERRGLCAAMQESDVEVVHAHWTYEFALAATRSGRPSLVTVHDWAPAVLRHHRDVYRAVRLLMQVSCLRSAEHITAVSPYLAEKVERYYHKTPSVIPNGIPRRLSPVSNLPVQSDPLTFGSLVSGVDPLKNLGTLLQAFQLLRSRISQKVWLFVAGGGCGPEEPLASWARSRGLAQNVTFRGAIAPHQVQQYMDSLDVFVHPSLEESFGMVLLEAMACGRPVVAGESSGAVSWLVGKAAGALVDVRSVSELADGMTLLLDAQERMRMGASAQERAQDFDMARVAEMYVARYESMT